MIHIEWPSRSPDLTHLDFFLMGFMWIDQTKYHISLEIIEYV